MNKRFSTGERLLGGLLLTGGALAAWALSFPYRRPTAVVHTTQGAVQGVRENGIDVFKGIPYVTFPVGARRFKAPQPPAPWAGVRAARQFGSQGRAVIHHVDDVL